MSQEVKVNNPYIQTEVQTATADAAVATTTATAVATPSLTAGFDTRNFLLGALVGAVGAYVLTNENAQKAIFKTIAKGSSMFQAGIEEMKERFEDAKAEMEASHHH